MPDYIVKQGDSVESIAYDHGFFWEVLWNDPQNAELKRLRKDPNVLLPGDIVFIPDLRVKEESGATEQRHQFRVKGVPAKLRLRILETEEEEEDEDEDEEIIDLTDDFEWFEEDGLSETVPPQGIGPKPRANVSYLLELDNGAIIQGETDDNGQIECNITPNMSKARLVLEPGTADEEVIDLKIGHLDPVEKTSGVQARLNNLGFRCGPVDGVLGPRTRRALKHFQASAGLKATGELDESTTQKLYEAHEST